MLHSTTIHVLTSQAGVIALHSAAHELGANNQVHVTNESTAQSAPTRSIWVDLLVNVTGGLLATYLTHVIIQLKKNHARVGLIVPGGDALVIVHDEKEEQCAQRVEDWIRKTPLQGARITLLAEAQNQAETRGALSDSRRAVVVGINHHVTLSNLVFAEPDALVVSEMLRLRGWDVELFLGSEFEVGGRRHQRGQTMLQALKQYLEEFFLGASPNAFLVFYFAGHGILYLTPNKNDYHGSLAFPHSDERDPATALSMQYLIQDLILASPSERILVGLACCHAGAAFHRISDRGSATVEALLGNQNMRALETRASKCTNATKTSGKKIIAFSDAHDLLTEIESRGDDDIPKGISTTADAWCAGWNGKGRAWVSLGKGRSGVDFASFQGYLNSSSSVQVTVVTSQTSGEVVLWEQENEVVESQQEPVADTYLASLGYTSWRSQNSREYLLAPYTHIPRGSFAMGSSQGELVHWNTPSECQNEVQFKNHSRWMVPAARTYDFEIAKFPVTVAEFRLFLAALPLAMRHQYSPSNWDTQLRHPSRPVVFLTLGQAKSYAEWLSTVSGQIYDIASEAEWEKAARWGPNVTLPEDARVFPWSDDDSAWEELGPEWPCNNNSGLLQQVGSHRDESRYEARDMTGNVQEWTRSRYLPLDEDYVLQQPGEEVSLDSTSTHAIKGDDKYVVRGGSFSDVQLYNVRAARRRSRPAQSSDDDLGFRLVRRVD